MKPFVIVCIVLITCLAVVIITFLTTIFIQNKARKQNRHVPYGPYEALFKRLLDILLSSFALVVLSPLILITAILVRIKLGKPVIFSQERPGRIDNRTSKERLFKLHKFRTMTDGRDQEGNLLPDGERLVPFGKALRTTSIDELPEFVNIIKGEMSIIGPRPLLTSYLPYYTEMERHRHDVRPGLSGLAQVNGRNRVDWDERLAYDIEYVNKITFLGDCHIVLRTIVNMFAGDGASSNSFDVETCLNEVREKRTEL